MSRGAPRVPPEVLDEAARARGEPASALATILLGSDRPPLARLLCRERHRLGAVYVVDGRRILALPERVFLSSAIYREVVDDTQESIFVPNTFDIDAHTGTGSLLLRCRCRMWTTTVADVRRQLDAGGARARRGWVMVSGTYPNTHPNALLNRPR